MAHRTKQEIEANEIDCDLHRLSRRMERLASEAVPRDRKTWDEASLRVHRARVGVRSLMHRDDVAKTE